MNKKWIILFFMLLCLTSCKTQPAPSAASTLTEDTSEASSPSESIPASAMPQKPLDRVIKQTCEELCDPAFQLEVELSNGKSMDKTGSMELGQGIAQLLEVCPYENIEQLDIESLDNEMVDNRIQFQVIGSDHWTQVICYMLSTDYGDKAGKTFVEMVPSTQEYQGLKGYDMADAVTFLYDAELYPQIDSLIQKMI